MRRVITRSDMNPASSVSDPRAGKKTACLFHTAEGPRIVSCSFDPRSYSSPTSQIKTEFQHLFFNPSFNAADQAVQVEKIHGRHGFILTFPHERSIDFHHKNR
jgi:hypothetical protein